MSAKARKAGSEKRIATPAAGGRLPAPAEEHFRFVAETAHDAIFFADSSGQVVFWNRAAADMFGYAADEITGLPLSTIIPPRLRRAHERGVELAFSGNLPVSGKTTEITGLRKNGDEFPLELTLATWESGDGAFLTAIGRDITDRRRAEEELRTSEERYRSLFEESPIALWEGDFSSLRKHLDDLRRQGVADFRRYLEDHPDESGRCLTMIRVLDVNRAALSMFGAKGKEDLLNGLAAVTCDDSLPAFREALVALAEGKSIFEGESVTRTLLGKKSQVILRWVVAPDRGRPPSRLLLSMTDMTAHKNLEAQFYQSQKMEALGRLAGGVAHDFNNLLTAIMSNTEVLLLDLGPEDPGRQNAAVIQHSADEAGKLISQLLALSRMETPDPEMLDLNESLEKMSRLFPHILGDEVTFTLNLGAGIEPIGANPGQIEQVVLNLIVNARDAMPEGGTVAITTSPSTVEEGDSSFGGLPPGPCTVLTVSDSGAGIPADDLQHMFEPFFTTKQNGTGLGLSTVYGIVTQHRGRIAASSAVGKGTTFTIHFPSWREA